MITNDVAKKKPVIAEITKYLLKKNTHPDAPVACSRECSDLLASYHLAEKFGWHPREQELLTVDEYEAFLHIDNTLASIDKLNRDKEKNRGKKFSK